MKCKRIVRETLTFHRNVKNLADFRKIDPISWKRGRKDENRSTFIVPDGVSERGFSVPPISVHYGTLVPPQKSGGDRNRCHFRVPKRNSLCETLLSRWGSKWSLCSRELVVQSVESQRLSDDVWEDHKEDPQRTDYISARDVIRIEIPALGNSETIPRARPPPRKKKDLFFTRDFHRPKRCRIVSSCDPQRCHSVSVNLTRRIVHLSLMIRRAPCTPSDGWTVSSRDAAKQHHLIDSVGLCSA